MRARSPRELVAAQGVLAVRICRAAHVTARITHQIQVALPCLGTVMSGCVCRSIRFLPDGVSRTVWRLKCRVVYVRSCAARRMEGFCPCLETCMSGYVCPVMRNPQSTARRYRIPSISVRLRMPRHTGRARAGRNDDQDSRTSCTRHTSRLMTPNRCRWPLAVVGARPAITDRPSAPRTLRDADGLSNM